MSQARTALALGILLGALSGCTSLESNPVSSNSTVSPGLTYRLPGKQLTVRAAFQITGCNPSEAGALIEAEVTVDVAETLVGMEAYTVNYQELNGLTKVTNTQFSIGDNGLLTGINASVTDQSGAIMQNTASTIASVARATALPAPLNATVAVLSGNFRQATEAGRFDMQTLLNGLGTEEGETLLRGQPQLKALDGMPLTPSLKRELAGVKRIVADACAPVEGHLQMIAKLSSDLREAKIEDKKRQQLQSEASSVRADLAAYRQLVDYYSALGDKTEKNRLLQRIALDERKYIELQTKLSSAGESKTDQLTEQLAQSKAQIRVTQSSEFIPIAGALDKTVRLDIRQLAGAFDGRLNFDDVELPAVGSSVKPVSGTCGDPVTSSCEALVPDQTKGKLGIVYRIPRAAWVTTYCDCKASSAAHSYERIPISEKVVMFPQLGPTGTLNLDNKVFDDNLLEVAFSGTTGAVTKASFRAKSRGEVGSGALKGVGEQYLTTTTEIRADKVAAANEADARAKARIEIAASELALQSKQAETDLARAKADAGVASADVELQNRLVALELERLRDQQRLDAVRSGTATAAEVELEALNVREKLLKQRLAILKLEKELEAESVAPKETALQ